MEPGLALLTGEVSKKLGRGRHTTRHVELFSLTGGGYIADTPGFGSFDVEQMETIRASELQYCFPEFAPYLGRCRFADCAHLREPGCAVLEALEEGKIQPTRTPPTPACGNRPGLFGIGKNNHRTVTEAPLTRRMYRIHSAGRGFLYAKALQAQESFRVGDHHSRDHCAAVHDTAGRFLVVYAGRLPDCLRLMSQTLVAVGGKEES